MGRDEQNLFSGFPKKQDLNHAVFLATETSLNSEILLNHLDKLNAQVKVVC